MNIMKSMGRAAFAAMLVWASPAFSQTAVSYTIHWAPPTDPTVSRVLVYRSLTGTLADFVPIGSTAVSDTAFVDEGGSLAGDTRYYYSLRSQTAAGTLGLFSDMVSGITISDTAPDSLKNQCRIDSVASISGSMCRVYWSTAALSTGKLRYWRLGTSTVLESASTTTPALHHETLLTGLSENQIYFARAVSHGSSAALTISAAKGFTAAPPASAFAIVTSVDTLVVPEADTAELGVKLSAEPQDAVEVTLVRSSGDADLVIVSGSVLTFTPSDWNTYKTATVAAASDEDVENGSATVIVYVSAGGYADVKTIGVVESDNDALSFVLDRSELAVPEGGTAQFNVRLSNTPPAGVSVLVSRSSGDGDITVQSGGSLAFTTANWGVDQTVTLAAAGDADVLNGTATILVHAVSGAAMSDAVLAATEEDGGTLYFSFDVDTVSVPEAGTALFRVRLTSDPAQDVQVAVSRSGGDTDISVQSGSSLLFTPSNWSAYQTVTLAAAADAGVENGAATILAHAVSGPAVPDATIVAIEADDDGIYFALDDDTVTVGEGSIAQFRVKLTNRPPANVSVSVARLSGDESIRVLSGGSLVFTSVNWNVFQTVILAADQDDDSRDGIATIRIRALSGASISDAALIAREDDDDPGDHGLAAAPGEIRIYPMPFRPGKGGPLQFDYLPGNGSVAIFDLAGRNIGSAGTVDANGHSEWDGTNAMGSTVASGRYFIVIRNAAGEVIDKRAILVVR